MKLLSDFDQSDHQCNRERIRTGSSNGSHCDSMGEPDDFALLSAMYLETALGIRSEWRTIATGNETALTCRSFSTLPQLVTYLMSPHRRLIAGPWAFALLIVMLLDPHDSFAQLIVGHRGASSDAPENTLAAFRLAFEQGADGIEGDFYVSADKQIVCIHDKTTKRTAGKSMDVAQSTLSQLQQLEYGSWFNETFRGEPIPTFRDVLKIIPSGKWFVIELKTGPEIVPLLKQELESAARSEIQILIIAFDERTVHACKQQMPQSKVHWLTGFKNELGTWQPSIEQVVATAKRCGADGIGFQGNREMLTEQNIASLKSKGIKEFHVWTIDSADDARYFQSQGAFGITTNRPQFIRQSLETKP